MNSNHNPEKIQMNQMNREQNIIKSLYQTKKITAGRIRKIRRIKQLKKKHKLNRSKENNHYSNINLRNINYMQTSSKLHNNFCFENDDRYVNKFTNSSNSEFFSTRKGFFRGSRDGKNTNFSFDWWEKNKCLISGESMFSKRKFNNFIESDNEDFDKIYNNIFCKIKNFEDGNKNSSNEEISKMGELISKELNAFNKITASKNNKNSSLGIHNSENNLNTKALIDKNNNILKPLKSNLSIFQNDKSSNKLNHNITYNLNEEKSNEAFNEWYKSFYDFGNEKKTTAFNSSYEIKNNNAKTNEKTALLHETNKVLNNANLNNSKSEIEVEIELETEKNNETNENKDLVSNANKVLNDSGNVISCFSKNLTILASEKMLYGFPSILKDPSLNPYLQQSSNKVKKEFSIISKSKQSLDDNEKQLATSKRIFNTIEKSKTNKNLNNNNLIIDNNKNLCATTNTNINNNLTKNQNLSIANKNPTLKLEMFKVQTENKVKSAKEIFLANLAQFKINQPNENLKIISQIENYVNSIKENIDEPNNTRNSNNNNQNNITNKAIKIKANNQTHTEENFSHKFSFKELQNLQNRRSSEKANLLNICNSAKGRFIRNFLISKEPLENLLINRKINCTAVEENSNNFLQPPNKFLEELMEISRNLKVEEEEKEKEEEENDFYSVKIQSQDLLLKENANLNNLIFSQIEKPQEEENSSNNLLLDFLQSESKLLEQLNSEANNQFSFEQILSDTINSIKKNEQAAEAKNELIAKEKIKAAVAAQENSNENQINFEIDILSNNINKIQSRSEKEILIQSKSENANQIFLGKKRFSLQKQQENQQQQEKYKQQQQNKNLRKKGFKYKMFSKEDKKFCIDLLKIFDYSAVAKFCNIPIKSLKRWAIIGPERKKGGGRKTRDPEMEVKLIKWINEKIKKQEYIDTKIIKEKALEFTKVGNFMASKGWFNKFQKKYKFEVPNLKSKEYRQFKFFGNVANKFIEDNSNNCNGNSDELDKNCDKDKKNND